MVIKDKRIILIIKDKRIILVIKDKRITLIIKDKRIILVIKDKRIILIIKDEWIILVIKDKRITLIIKDNTEMNTIKIPTAEKKKIQGLALGDMTIVRGVPGRKENMLNVRVTIRLKTSAPWFWLLQ